MPTKRLCSVDGCDKPHKAYGWCKAHYLRWKRCGTVGELPIKRRIPSAIEYINNVALPFKGSECLIWPTPIRKGSYPLVTVDGVLRIATRYICIRVNGNPPSDIHLCCHSCGNRACVNPAHLRWGTPLDNCADMLGHGTRRLGTRHSHAKVTEEDVRAIRASSQPRAELCKKYKISSTAVWSIINRKTWKHIA